MLKEGTKLLKYQTQDVRYLVKNPRAANFNDCGLGKTLEELVVIAENRRYNSDKVLIFCPKSCLISWADEIKKHTILAIPEDVKIVTGTKEEKEQLINSEGQIFITNYETALTNFEDLICKKFTHVVLDESTRIKNPTAITSKAINALTEESNIVHIMSGLPITQSPIDIYSQFRIMDRGATFGKSFNYFKALWFKKKGKWPALRWELKSEVKKDFINLISSHSIRRLRSSVVELPSVTTIRRVAEWKDINVKREYHKLQNTILESLSITFGGEIRNLQNQLVKLTKLTQYTSGFIYDDNGTPHFLKDNPKLKELSHILHDYNVFKNKIVIVGVFRPELAMVFNLCKEMGLNPTLIHGDTVSTDRAERLERFRCDHTCHVLVANQKTISYGLNLQFCNTIIFYNISFSVELYKQLCDRIHRIGQKKNCLLIHLLVSDTFDFNKYDIVVNKLEMAEEIMKAIEEVDNVKTW